jgi:hypothetical protein
LHELRAAVAAAALEDVPSLARPRAEEDDDAAGGGDVVAETRAFGALHTLMGRDPVRALIDHTTGIDPS